MLRIRNIHKQAVSLQWLIVEMTWESEQFGKWKGLAEIYKERFEDKDVSAV